MLPYVTRSSSCVNCRSMAFYEMFRVTTSCALLALTHVKFKLDRKTLSLSGISSATHWQVPHACTFRNQIYLDLTRLLGDIGILKFAKRNDIGYPSPVKVTPWVSILFLRVIYLAAQSVKSTSVGRLSVERQAWVRIHIVISRQLWLWEWYRRHSDDARGVTRAWHISDVLHVLPVVQLQAYGALSRLPLLEME